MKQQLIILCITLFINSYMAECQNTYPVDKWMEYIESLSGEDVEEAKIESLYAEL